MTYNLCTSVLRNIDSIRNMEELITALDEECRRRGLRTSFAKTEVIGIIKRRGREDVKVDLQQRRVKQVVTF